MKAKLKALGKRVARPLWRLTAPVRRPLARKFDERVSRLVATAIEAHWRHVHVTVDPPDLGRLEAMMGELSTALGMARRISEHHAEEANLLMDGLVREVARLQLQLEGLAEVVEELREEAPLVVVGGDAGELRAG